MKTYNWKFEQYDVLEHIHNHHNQISIHARMYDVDKKMFLYLYFVEDVPEWNSAAAIEKFYRKVEK